MTTHTYDSVDKLPDLTTDNGKKRSPMIKSVDDLPDLKISPKRKGVVVFEEPIPATPTEPEEDIITMSRRAQEQLNKTKLTNVAGGELGSNVTSEPDLEARKEGERLENEIKKRGYSSKELATEFEGFPQVELDKPGKRDELLNLRKTNPIEYRMKLNATKNQYDVLEAVKNNIYNSLPENTPYREFKASQAGVHAANEYNDLNIQDGDSLNDKYNKILGKLTIINENIPADQRPKMISRLQEDVAQHITGTSKQLKEELANSEWNGKLDPNQYAGLKTLQLFQPDKYNQMVRLLGVKAPDRQDPYLDPDLDPSDAGEFAPYVEGMKETAFNKAKGAEVIKKELSDIGRSNTVKSIHRKQYSLDEAYKNASEEDKPLIAAQYLQYENVLKNLGEDAKKDDERYPLLAQMKFDEQVKEILQDPGFTAAGYGVRRFNKGFKSSFNSLENILTNTFGSKEAKEQLELERLGGGKTDENDFYLPESYRSKGSQIIPKFSKELSDGVKAIYNDDSLSISEREKKAKEFVAHNQDKADWITNPDAGKSRNFFSKATLYGNAGMIGDVASVAAQTLGLGNAGVGRLLSAAIPMFTTTQDDFYKQAVAEGNPNPMSYANTHASIMALAGMVNPDIKILRNAFGANTQTGKFLAGISDETWDSIVNKNSQLLNKFGNAAKSAAKEGAKISAVYGAGTSIASDLADKGFGGKDISMDEIIDHAVEATKHTALNSVAILGLGAVRNFKTTSPLEKANIWEAGSNLDVTLKQLEDAATRGDITPEQAKTYGESAKEISKLIDEVPTQNAKGKPLTDKQRVDYLYNKLIAGKAKELKQGATEGKTEELEGIEEQANGDNNKIVSGYSRKTPSQESVEAKEKDAKLFVEELKDGEIINDIEYAAAKDNPMQYFETVAQQANNVTADKVFNIATDAREAAKAKYGESVIDYANQLFPEYKEIASQKPKHTVSTPNIVNVKSKNKNLSDFGGIKVNVPSMLEYVKRFISDKGIDEIKSANVSDLVKIKKMQENAPQEEGVESVSTIGTEGLKEPLVLIRDKDGNMRLQQGHHRLEEAIKLGATKLPVVVVEAPKPLVGEKDVETGDVIGDKLSNAMPIKLENFQPESISAKGLKYEKAGQTYDNEDGRHKVGVYDIKRGDKTIGQIEVHEYPDKGHRFSWIDINKELQGKGLGKELYRDANKRSIEETGKPLWAKSESLNEASERVWSSLVKSGEAVKSEDGTYRFKSETNAKADKAGIKGDQPAKTGDQTAIPPKPPEATEGQGEVPPIEPPKPPLLEAEMGGEGRKELDYLANNVPDSGKVAEYMSKDTIEKYTGETPTNDQSRGVQELQIALDHGEKIIEKAQILFGKEYVDKTIDYIDQSTAPVSNKALMYVSLENALGREKLLNPERSEEITKQQALVYEQSQKFARENSLALNYQKLRRIAKAGYDIEKVTDNFFSADEKASRNELKKSIEADADTINKEAERMERGGMTPEIEKAIQEGVEKEVAKIYESLPKEKKSIADKAIQALENVQKKLRGKTYESTIGVPVAIIDAGITTVKLAIKAGVKVADAIELGINKIKEKWGKEWLKEAEFRKDITEAFKGIDIEPAKNSVKDLVKEALIEKGFGRQITVKGEKRNILDWKKLAGRAGSMERIRENVNAVLQEKGLRGLSDKEKGVIKEEFLKEYVELRASVIEKTQSELARRNKENVTPEQKSAAKKLSELYSYGLFEKNPEEFDILVNKALGVKVSPEGFGEAKEIAKAMETVYSSSFKGTKLNDISGKAAIERLDDRMRILLFKEAKKQGNNNLKLATIVRNYFEIQQTMVLNNLKQALENPFSGLEQKVIDKISSIGDGTNTKELVAQRRKLMSDVYKDMVLRGGIGFGKSESTFVNRQHLDDFVNKLSDNQLYHAVASVATGKTTLNAMDAMWKSSMTEKKFAGNLIKVLTHESNKNRMSSEEAQKFVTERLTGQTFKDAQATAEKLIAEINKNTEPGKELIPANKEQVDRIANDIVKASLEMGGKITSDQINAAYNAAYRSAGLNLGHVANNFLSAMIQGQSGKIEAKLTQALKDKEWDRAAFLTYYSAFYRNILNPFVGGGTNWLVLKFEKTGLGLFTGLGYRLGTKTQLDLSTERGQKLMEDRLFNQSRIKDNFMRGVIGGITSTAVYGTFLGLAKTDDYRKWRGKNKWAARYLDVITPEAMLAHMAVKDDAVKKYASQSFNKNDAFDATTKLIKAAEYAVEGDAQKAKGALGEAAGSKINIPLPWRLVKDGVVIYRGATGKDPYHGNYQPSEGFMSGVLQGGAIEFLGYRPMPAPQTGAKKSKKKKKKE